MTNGTIGARKGQKEINALLAKIHLVRGNDPLGLAEGTAKSFKQANAVTTRGVKEWITNLGQMPTGAREKAIDANQKILKAWADGHPKIEREIDSLTAYQIRKFGATNKQLREGVEKGATGPVARAFQELAHGVGGALGNIGTNTNRMLKALGLHSMVEFNALVRGPSQLAPLRGQAAADRKHHEVPGTYHGRGVQGAATGYLPGSGLRDTVPIMAAPGEAVLNRHQQGPVNTALEATYGFNLDGLFHRIQTPHYMASGGEVKVSGPGALARIGHGALAKAVSAVNTLIGKH
jgi:hypothetical protein